jgi:phage/plasmid-associated DNA primase
MFFDRKGLPGLTVCPTARLMISCNNRPRLSDKSDGVWRRMLLIPWLIQIPEEQRIRGMDRATWWNESGELPGLFNWAVAGLHRLRTQGGFSRCRAMEEAIADYQEEMSPTRSFLADNVEENAASSIQSSVIYAIYRKWCQEHGYHPLADRSFGKELRRIFRKAHRRRGGARESRFWFYEGICFSKTEICGEKVDKNVLF